VTEEQPAATVVATPSLDETVIEDAGPRPAPSRRGTRGEVVLDVKGLRTSKALREGERKPYSPSKVIHGRRGEPADLSPQPTVNNFALRAQSFVKKFTAGL